MNKHRTTYYVNSVATGRIFLEVSKIKHSTEFGRSFEGFTKQNFLTILGKVLNTQEISDGRYASSSQEQVFNKRVKQLSKTSTEVKPNSFEQAAMGDL